MFWQILFSALLIFSTLITPAVAQQPLGVAGEIGLAFPQAHVREADSSILVQFERMKLLLEHGHLDDAIATVTDLLDEAESSGRIGQAVVRIDDRRHVSLREYCHHLLANLPPKALARYRQSVDPIAEAWYRQGIAERNERLLQRIVDRMFCSRWGDDALLALGEMAIERGEYQQARNCWQRIGPHLRSQLGQSPLWFVYPDTNLDLAAVRARLALTSIYEGRWDRAQQEIHALQALHPVAQGHLAGSEGNYAQRLSKLLEEARRWPTPAERDDSPTFGRSPQRTNATPRTLGLQFHELWAADRKTDAPTSMASGPLPMAVATGNALVYGEVGQILAADLGTGKPVCGRHLAVFSPEHSHTNSAGGSLESSQPSLLGLTADGSRIFATYGASQPLAPLAQATDLDTAAARSILIGLDLNRDGALLFRQSPASGRCTYAGPPLPFRSPGTSGRAANRVAVAMVEHDLRMRIWVACYDIESQQPLWKCEICQLDPPQTAAGDLPPSEPVPPMVLTFDSGLLYCQTNCGAVAALRTSDGQPLWIRTYRRMADWSPEQFAPSGPHPPSPAVYRHGLLLVAPTDSQRFMALDAATGAIVWTKLSPGPQVRILGATQQKLVLAGNRLWAYDAKTGKRIARWGNDTKDAATDASGNALLGVIAGDTVYWPTEGAIRTVDLVTGRASEVLVDGKWWIPQPFTLATELEEMQLVVAGGRLVVATQDHITVLGQAVPTTGQAVDNEPGAHTNQSTIPFQSNPDQ